MDARRAARGGGGTHRRILNVAAAHGEHEMRLLTVLTDWRRVLIYTHRWLGIAGCLVFLMWFVSGVVMMYERMPRLTAEERLARLPALDASAIRIAPADAARHAKVAPDRIRVG